MEKVFVKRTLVQLCTTRNQIGQYIHACHQYVWFLFRSHGFSECSLFICPYVHICVASLIQLCAFKQFKVTIHFKIIYTFFFCFYSSCVHNAERGERINWRTVCLAQEREEYISFIDLCNIFRINAANGCFFLLLSLHYLCQINPNGGSF